MASDNGGDNDGGEGGEGGGEGGGGQGSSGNNMKLPHYARGGEARNYKGGEARNHIPPFSDYA